MTRTFYPLGAEATVSRSAQMQQRHADGMALLTFNRSGGAGVAGPP